METKCDHATATGMSSTSQDDNTISYHAASVWCTLCYVMVAAMLPLY